MQRIVKAVFVLCAATGTALSAQTFTTLLGFDSTDGAKPHAGLLQATDGNFYGTTVDGGANANGTVFKITPSGTLTTLYSFCSQIGCTDGSSPYAGLVQASNGDVYGTTQFGGSNRDTGTIFKITTSGTLTTLYSFCSQSDCRDGANPLAGLIQAANGELFGTTRLGGSSNFGTIFKINPSGVLTTLFSFDFRDGEYPHAGLVQAANGDLYGTTHNGGANNLGTVFRITLGAISSSCVWRWVQTYGPELDKRCRPYLKPTNQSWRVDETYIKVKGQERFLYRAVDSSGQTIDFLLTAKRDTAPEPPKESRLIATTRTGCCSHCLNCRRARHSHRKSP